MHRSTPVIGIIIAGIGIAGMAGVLPAIYEFTYPIVWWGLLMLMDSWNSAHACVSLWHNNLPRFLMITVPLSTLYWVGYELLNLAMPQWRYSGGTPNVLGQVLFGFVAFATVIPIIMECFWLDAGNTGIPLPVARFAAEWRIVFVVAGVLALSLPIYSPFFWINQAMWLGPGLILLPFVNPDLEAPNFRFWRGIVFGSLIGGLLWELINYWSHTRWEYLIQLNQPHLFEMPVLGYFGFIPFGFSIVVLYAWYSRLPSRVVPGLALYVVAIAGQYAITVNYARNGLWVVK